MPISPAYLEALANGAGKTRKQLATAYGDEAARWVEEQLTLREKARKKFEQPEQYLYEREALEQATHHEVAAYHAAQFPNGALVADLTVGIGADAMALAKRGPVVAYELDPNRAELAQYNCPGVDIRTEDGLTVAEDVSYIWADPDRRSNTGKRLREMADYAPNPLDIPRDRSKTGIKLSPLLKDEELASVGKRVEFISHQRECKEAICWSGSEVEPGQYAVHIESGEVLPTKELYDLEDAPLEFIFDADPAATRAHALGNFGIPALGESPGYLTGPAMTSVWLSAYEVLDHGSFDEKRVKKALRTLGNRVYEVKQRGAKLDPSKVMKQVATDGEPVSLICWVVGQSVRYAIARRI
ncbi:MAG TPA: hypothetical protein VK171_04195 [Fimbriimonas sp.]|nr:hypothetical protein [Fimbriimonas sp.]